MKISFLSFKIASWTLIIGGLFHSITDLVTPKTAEQFEFIEKMTAMPIHVLGSSSNIFSFFQGFSLMMGLLLFGYGLLNLMILKNNKEAILPSNILVLNIIVMLVSVALCIKYFFIIPILLTGIPFLGYSISFFTSRRSNNH